MERFSASRTVRSTLVSGLLLALAAAACDCGGTGFVAVKAGLSVNPEAVDFGKTALGSVAEQWVDLQNTGAAPLDILSIRITTSAKAADGTDEIGIAKLMATDCQGKPRDAQQLTIDGNGCARFAVRYRPIEMRAVNAVVTVDSSDGERPSVEIPIRGEGVASAIRVCVLTADGTEEPGACTAFTNPDPAVSTKLPELAFGAVPVGDTATRKVRIHNDGEAALSVTSATVQGDFVQYFTIDGAPFSATIGAKQSADATVSFKPTGQLDGPAPGKFVIVSADQAHPSIELPIVAESQGPRLCVTPADGLDFGSVPMNTTRSLSLNFKNCGFVPYNLTTLAFFEDNQVAPVNFAIGARAIPAMPKAMAPGDEFDIDVNFTPQSVSKLTGYFSVVTDFSRSKIVVKGEGVANCGGGTRPVAVIKVKKGTTDITANPNVEPLDTVTFDATGSTPRTGARYKWRLVSQPQNGTQNIVPRANPALANLFAELNGDYVVELVVADQYNCDSAPVQAKVSVASTGKVHVQLTWAENYGDVDLHFLGPNGTFGSATSDCHYSNCKKADLYTIDWGRNNTTSGDGNPANDPTLDIDELWGNGPENVTHDLPFDGTYAVNVHYYCSRQLSGFSYGNSLGPARATLRVYVNGVQQFIGTQSLNERQIWTPATIQVSNGGQTITVTPSTAPLTNSTADQACQ